MCACSDCTSDLIQNNEYSIIIVYVDDVLMVSNDINYMQQLKQQFGADFNIKDLGEVAWLLGMRVTRNRLNRIITLSQQAAFIH
jgi:Reverse transcriptase (RNA-dependent DNA polymerase)